MFGKKTKATPFWLALGAAGLYAALISGLAAAPVKEAGLTEAEFKELKPILDVKNQLWTTIPWKYSITEARKLAVETKKPIFLNVNTGNCLGNV